MLSARVIEKILGIEKPTELDPRIMAKRMTLTVFPYKSELISENVLRFYEILINHLKELGVTFVPYEEALVPLPISRICKIILAALVNSIVGVVKRISHVSVGNNVLVLSHLSYIRFGKKVKKGISVISLGEQESGNLPMDNTMSFSETSVITIVDKPKHIRENSEFAEHFDTAMNLFTYHMTNIAIAVDENSWILYNFNASHPTYAINSPSFKDHLLKGLIPKIAAPIRPPKLKEFMFTSTFHPESAENAKYVEDLVVSGSLLHNTGLYPPGKSLESMGFRNNFYRWIGAIHLDHRNGMSYGFLARQLPTPLSDVLSYEEARQKLGIDLNTKDELFTLNGNNYLKVSIRSNVYCLSVPEVWVLTQRSGANKTNLNVDKDIIKMGLVNGKLIMQRPANKQAVYKSYKPSFDTRVILAHAVGNAIIASILRKLNEKSIFAEKFVKDGMAIAHWHGYINPSFVPKGWYVHGSDNPHVSCSSPHSAIYALSGKMDVFGRAVESGEEYFGDIHIEPHHGTNINYWTLRDLGAFLSADANVSRLGNYYLASYTTY